MSFGRIPIPYTLLLLQLRRVAGGDAADERERLHVAEVGKKDNGEVVVGKAGQVGGEAADGAAVADDAVALQLLVVPPRAVGSGLHLGRGWFGSSVRLGRRRSGNSVRLDH